MTKIWIGNLCLALLLPFVASCGGTSNSASTGGTDDSAVDRFSDLVDDERETVMITTAEESAGEFSMSPAVFDTVIVRSVPATGSEARIVEVLLKGYFPDGCSELHDLTQANTEGGQTATLTMRRPQSAICTQVIRPYRFFFELEERFQPGEHTLTVNDKAFRFTVE